MAVSAEARAATRIRGTVGFPVRAKDTLSLGSIASVAKQTKGYVRFINLEGHIRPISLVHTSDASRTATTTRSDIFGEDGWIVGRPTIHGDADLPAIDYGQVWSRLRLRDPTVQANVITLAQGYLGGAFQEVVGIQTKHPLLGPGRLFWNQEADDAAGNATTTVNFAATNTRRKVRAVILKVHSSGDVASRTWTMTLRDLATAAGPTNWSIASDTWVSPTLTLTANEEGLMHVGEHGFLSTNDAGTLAYADNTTAPNPFPLWVDQDETADLIIVAGSGEAADDYDVWVQYEEWFVA